MYAINLEIKINFLVINIICIACTLSRDEVYVNLTCGWLVRLHNSPPAFDDNLSFDWLHILSSVYLWK